jgi:hypothetical protein
MQTSTIYEHFQLQTLLDTFKTKTPKFFPSEELEVDSRESYHGREPETTPDPPGVWRSSFPFNLLSGSGSKPSHPKGFDSNREFEEAMDIMPWESETEDKVKRLRKQIRVLRELLRDRNKKLNKLLKITGDQ